MSKEDIFVSRIPVPVLREANFPEYSDFSGVDALDLWSLYCPIWAPVDIAPYDNLPALRLQDKDPVDYAKAERQFPPSAVVSVYMQIVPMQNTHGELYIELQDGKGLSHMRIHLTSSGKIHVRSGAKWDKAGEYVAGAPLTIEINNNCTLFSNRIVINTANLSTQACASCEAVERIVFRTGDTHDINEKYCHEETPDISDSSDPVANAIFYIKSLTISPL